MSYRFLGKQKILALACQRHDQACKLGKGSRTALEFIAGRTAQDHVA